MKPVLLGTLASALSALTLNVVTEAQAIPSATSPDAISVRECRPPTDAKEAQVLAFDKVSQEAKLAVNLGNGEFKVVTVKAWDRLEDPRPLIPVIEAARITQGKVHFYTPNLNADPEPPVYDRQFLLVATLGGAQVCWATQSSLLADGNAGKSATTPLAGPDRRKPSR